MPLLLCKLTHNGFQQKRLYSAKTDKNFHVKILCEEEDRYVEKIKQHVYKLKSQADRMPLP